MKTIILNGSPRKDGNTSALVKMLMSQLEGEVLHVRTYDAKVQPCLDCRYCWTHPKCAIDDDMTEIYEWLQTADAVVLASPLNFSQLSGSLMSLLSRLQLFFAGHYIREDGNPKMKDKKGLLLIAAGGATKKPDLAIRMSRPFFRELKAEFIGCVASMNTDQVKAEDDLETVEMIKNMVAELSK